MRSRKQHLNPWLVAIGVLAVIFFASLAGLSPYIATKVKPVPPKVQPGDTYNVTYSTSATVPSVQINLCSDATNIPCQIMANNATGSQTSITIPTGLGNGQAHINVLEENTAQQLTGVIQSTSFVTIVNSSSNSTDLAAGSNSALSSNTTSTTNSNSVLSNLLNSFSSPTSNTPTPTTITPQVCQISDCGTKSGGGGQSQLCPNGTRESVVCGWQANENECDWAYPPCPSTPGPLTPKTCQLSDCNIPANSSLTQLCPNGTRVPLTCALLSSGQCGIPDCPASTQTGLLPPAQPTSQTPYFFFLYSQFFTNPFTTAQYTIVYVEWMNPGNNHLVYRSVSQDSASTWHPADQNLNNPANPIIGEPPSLDAEPGQNNRVMSQLDFNYQLGPNELFQIQVQDSQGNPVSQTYTYLNGYGPDPGQAISHYIPGQN